MFSKICKQCGAAFTTWSRDQANCSKKCGALARRRRILLRCPCGNTVERILSLKSRCFCSRKCRRLAKQERHQQRRRPKPTPEQRAALMREWILDMRATEQRISRRKYSR